MDDSLISCATGGGQLTTVSFSSYIFPTLRHILTGQVRRSGALLERLNTIRTYSLMQVNVLFGSIKNNLETLREPNGKVG